MNKEVLKEAGLTEGEIKVYLALLDIGATTSGPIVDKSGVARSIVYQILEKLIQKGLVSFIIKDKTKYYQASSPKKILEYAKDNVEKMESNIKEIEKILPDLINKQNYSPKSQATVYLGFKGLRTASEKMYDVLKKGETLYYVGVPAYQPEEQHIYWQKDHRRREKTGIKVKILFNKDTDKKVLANRNSFVGCDARYMPTEIKTPALFTIYKNVVLVMLQSPEVITVEIINQDIADSFKAYFDEFWKLSKPF